MWHRRPAARPGKNTPFGTTLTPRMTMLVIVIRPCFGSSHSAFSALWFLCFTCVLQSILVTACSRHFAAMARSYRGSSSRGATEHDMTKSYRSSSSKGAPEHVLALASTNVGLHGSAFGKNFEKNHAKRVQRLIQELLCGNTSCAGVLFCEVGNVDNLLN